MVPKYVPVVGLKSGQTIHNKKPKITIARLGNDLQKTEQNTILKYLWVKLRELSHSNCNVNERTLICHNMLSQTFYELFPKMYKNVEKSQWPVFCQMQASELLHWLF